MAKKDSSEAASHRSARSDLGDAKPLLRAIAVGMVLAVALVAAATMANSDAEEDAVRQAPVGAQQVSGSTLRHDPRGTY